MHVDKDFESRKTQISQHLAWLGTFFELWLHLNTEIRVIFPNSTFLLSKFQSFTHVTSCYHACYCGNITFCYDSHLLPHVAATLKKSIYTFLKSSSNM